MAKKKKQTQEPDSVFFLKIVLFFILGTVWVRISATSGDFSLPVGLIFGVVFAHHEHFQIDRKIEYAVLFVSTVISFYLPLGLLI